MLIRNAKREDFRMTMKSSLPYFVILLLVLPACGMIATPIWQAPTKTPTVVAQVNTPTSVLVRETATSVLPSMTPLPPTETTAPSTATPTPVLPTPTAASTPTAAGEIDPHVIGDPEQGQELFNTFQPDAGYMCATCHWTDREDRLIGPGLLNIGTRATTRVEGQNAVQYIYTSIVNPGAYVVEDFPDGLMPQNWTQIYSQQEINDIIAYLLTLK